MFKIAYLVLFLLLSLNMSADSIQVLSWGHDSSIGVVKDSLELEKMILEIDELKAKNQRSLFNLIISLLAGLTGFVTIVWTIYQGAKNYKIQLKQQKLKTISDLLVLLNDSAPNKRIGAAKGLSKYSNSVCNELISALGIENDDFVREAVEEALLDISFENFEKLIVANRNAIKSIVTLLGELSAVSISQSFIDSQLNMDEEMRNHLIRNNRYLYDLGKKIAIRKNVAELSEIPSVYTSRILNIKRSVESTGKIITKLLNTHKYLVFSTIDISYNELYKSKLDGLKADKLYAISTLCRHVVIRNASLDNSFFKHADMFDATINVVTIRNSNFKGCNLRQSQGTNVEIRNSSFADKAVLSEVNFTDLSATDSDFSQSKMKNFAAFKSSFINCKFNASELQHSSITNSAIDRCFFFGANIIEGDFSGTTIENTKFNGADLRGANFENAKLKKVDFSGANLKNIKTTNWILEDCNFEKSKNYNIS